MKNMERKPETLKEFQSYIQGLYGQNNKEKSVEYIFSYLTRNTSYLSRSVIRGGEPKELYIKSISWLFSLSSKLEVDLKSAFESKFPGACPYCICSPCNCAETNKKPPAHIREWQAKEELSNRFRARINSAHKPPEDIDSSIKEINSLYPANRAIWKAYGSTYHFSRIFEELGEVHEAYGAFITKKATRLSLEEELADTCAWLLSAWSMITQDRLQDALITYYYDGCPVCKQNPCKCEDYASRIQAIVNIDDIEKFKALVVQLSELSTEKAEALKEIATSLDSVKETQSTTEAKRTVARGLELITDLEKATQSASSISGSIKAIYENATSMAQGFSWFQ